jgi:NADH-quinone oxidoreductase subunit M
MTVNNALGFPLLSCLIFLPIVAGLLLMLVPRAQSMALKAVATTVALATLVLSLAAVGAFNLTIPGPQLEEYAPWVPALGIGYHLAVDGLNLWLVVLTAFLTVVALVAAWPRMEASAKDACVLLLLLEGGILGALMAFDLVLYFVFWEAMLIPMYLVIGLLGGQGRTTAALKFFVYTTVGSLFMLVAMIALSVTTAAAGGATTFDLLELAKTPVEPAAQAGLFLAFALAFAIKVPLVPLHTWLPDTYTRTPLAALVLGTMLVKVGAYGFLRFCFTLFPAASAQFAPLISTLAVISILYGWLSAYGQRDIVRLIAYTSIAHMGFVVLGAFAFNNQGIQGSILQMVNHGITTGALFLMAMVLLDRAGTARIDSIGGFGGRYPVMYGVFLLVLFSSVGLPGLNGFVGEFLILLGTYRATPAFALIALLGVVLAAVVMLWMFRLTMQGPMHGAEGGRLAGRDLTQAELTVLSPLLVLIVVLGLFPNLLLGQMEASVTQLVTGLQNARQAHEHQIPAHAPQAGLLMADTPDE